MDLADLGEPMTKARLGRINQSLGAVPYGGMRIACPYVPPLVSRNLSTALPYGEFVIERLLPRVVGASASLDRTATGINGWSMGGRVALFVGLSHPEAFGVVGAFQPALRDADAPIISGLAKEAMARAPLQLRIVTTVYDPFAAPARVLHQRLNDDGVPHQFEVLPGFHDQEFVRASASVEMLVWHERAQRGLPTV
jgi:hypothetical protein